MVDKAPSISMELEQYYLSLEVIEAIQNNDVPRLKLLHKCGTDFNMCDEDGNTVFHLAIQNHAKLDTFEYLLTLDDVITKDDFNSVPRTPIQEAFRINSGEIYASRLIESGCRVDCFYPRGSKVLHLAVKNKWIEVAELLIERGINIEYRNDNVETTLHLAVKTGDIDILWMLLFYGANPNNKCVHCFANENGRIYMHLTFFDLVVKQLTTYPTLEIFLDPFYCYEKNFSLFTFIEAMEKGSPIFYKLIEITCDIHFTCDELMALIRKFSFLNPKMWRLFTQECDYILEEMLCRCRLDDFFFPDLNHLHNYTQNLFILLESSVSDTFVQGINASFLALPTRLIKYFAERRESVDLLCQILCCMLSYGIDINADALNVLYVSFGYCDLFKIMLHMDIKEMERYAGKEECVFSRLLFDINLSAESVISKTYDEPIAYEISQYFTLPKFRLMQGFPVPTLLELARNRAREYITKKFKIKNSRGFYTILRALPIAEFHKKIISFEVKLYSL
ncbi:uncharacterized protein LOC135135383 [Zophobas morio]|uniref:uncharacterized protein LOC135135383 n=1 Tax=Zophobas morio TaxID=2755281 RepID=UPI003082A4A0